MNSARHHTDGVHSDVTPTESYVVTDHGLVRLPHAIETHRTLAEKLDAVGHVSPSIQMTSEEAGARARAQAKLASDAEVAQFNQSLAGYLSARDTRPSWSDRVKVIIANLWPKISHAFVALCVIVITAGALIVGCAVTAKGAEGRWVMAEITSYCPCALCCGTHDRTTANNTSTDAVPYAFAADRSLPFGVRVFVPVGLGVLDRVRADDRWFSVDDRGGALDTEARRYGVLRLDLRVREHGWAVRFGRRSLPVYVTTNP